MDCKNINFESLEMGYISKEKILEYVSEEDIFEYIFNYIPEEFVYVTSPFRNDTNPGCWFERDIQSGKLIFRDFTIGTRPLDCFDAIQIYYGLPNFYQTLVFIRDNLIIKKNKTKLVAQKQKAIEKKERKKVEIQIETRFYTYGDKPFWSKYQITSENLIQDGVFPVSRFKLLNTKKGTLNFNVSDLCYAYTQFDGGRKKLYSPYKQGRGKFITNCSPDDIGEYKSLVPSDNLIITKSYKDCRVLKNQGYNACWFQNEGMFPNKNILKKFTETYKYIYIFFDNDPPGINASQKLLQVFNSIKPNITSIITLPTVLLQFGIKDPSDFIHKRSKESLQIFLKQQILYKENN